MISEQMTAFGGVELQKYISNKPVVVGNKAVGVRVETREEGEEVVDAPTALDNLGKDSAAGKIEAIVIGQWATELYTTDETSDAVVSKLVELASVFKGLKHLFIGDMTYEECEISWIRQSDMSLILKAYPGLVSLGVRGGDMLSFTPVDKHDLQTLVIETGGLGAHVIDQICKTHWPKLKTLEIWTGTDNYGGDSALTDVALILDGRLFPSLVNLKIKNCEYADGVVKALVTSRIFGQLETLDLGMGTLGDEGAQALFESPTTRKLKGLAFDHHYVSQQVVEKLKSLGIPVSAEDAQEVDDDEGGRHIAVSE